MKGTFLLVLGLMSLFLSSCVSSTMIQSEPDGAKLYINNVYVGETPYQMSDQKIAMTCTAIRIEKEGYRTVQTMICKDEEIDVPAAVGGLFFTPIWLWVYKYYPMHNYVLQPLNKQNDYFDENDDDFKEYTVDDTQPNRNQETKAQKLRELKALFDDGVLTQEEYEKEKKKILDEEEW